MRRVIGALCALVILGCSGGGSNSPTDACDDYCEWLGDCGLDSVYLVDRCAYGLCDKVERLEGEDDDCDDAFVEWAECYSLHICPLYEVEDEICLGELDDLFAACGAFFFY